jgi:hypothetical protein
MELIPFADARAYWQGWFKQGKAQVSSSDSLKSSISPGRHSHSRSGSTARIKRDRCESRKRETSVALRMRELLAVAPGMAGLFCAS